MSCLEQVRTCDLACLERDAFDLPGVHQHGLVLMHGARSWEGRKNGFIALPTESGVFKVPIAHDNRGAPYAVDSTGREWRDLQVSLTDENDYIACAWALTGAACPLMGVGIDLASLDQFGRDSGRVDLSHLLLSEDEENLAAVIEPCNPALGKAALFASKEAAFKATAAPLRRWTEAFGVDLAYDPRCFVGDGSGRERGTGRDGMAQKAMDRMGIDRIEVHHTEVRGMAIVIALALGK